MIVQVSLVALFAVAIKTGLRVDCLFAKKGSSAQKTGLAELLPVDIPKMLLEFC